MLWIQKDRKIRMKKISIMIPCYNEVENVELMAMAVTNVLQETLPNYDYEILFIDNCSRDGTRDKLEEICARDRKVKAIFNVTNFGQFNSPFYGLCQTTGDCAISLCCDFQDPVEMIPTLVREWEKGHKIVSCIKTSSKESGIIYFLRTCYYKVIKGMSSVRMIEHFTGFGLYDKSFIAILRELDDPIPFLRGIVAEYGSGFNMIEIDYEQAKRRAGKTHNNLQPLRCRHAELYLLYESRASACHVSGIYLFGAEPCGGVYLPHPEADPLVRLSGRLCAACDRRFCHRLDPAVFHRTSGRIRFEYQHQGDSQAAGGGGKEN